MIKVYHNNHISNRSAALKQWHTQNLWNITKTICLSICLSICLYICLSICLPISLYIGLSKKSLFQCIIIPLLWFITEGRYTPYFNSQKFFWSGSDWKDGLDIYYWLLENSLCEEEEYSMWDRNLFRGKIYSGNVLLFVINFYHWMLF